MNIYSNLPAAPVLQLQCALLLYGSTGNNLAMRHSISDGAKPTLLEGHPVTQAELHAMLDTLVGTAKLELLPERVLAYNAQALVWWTPPSRRRMFYTGADRLASVAKALNGKTFHQPTLLWRLSSQGGLRIRALAIAERPHAKTPVCIAPYWNVDGSGQVCTGSMKRPGFSPSAIDQWEDAFFRSQFTHPNSGLRVNGAFGEIWRNSISKPFDVAALAQPKPKQTVQEFLR